MFSYQCNDDENVIHTILKWFETHRWREKVLNDKCLDINKQHPKEKSVVKTEELKIRYFLGKLKCKLEKSLSTRESRLKKWKKSDN